MFAKIHLNTCFLLFFFVFAGNSIDNLCSQHCLSYYDGCNVCGCKGNKPAICTLIVCDESQYIDPICQECETGYSWNNETRQCEIIKTCPSHCLSYSDGCNECNCDENGDFANCTNRQCIWERISKCLQCEDGYEWDEKTRSCEAKCVSNCDIYFDGCNDYRCISLDNGGYHIVNKTRKACYSYQTPYCRRCHSNLKWTDCALLCTATCEDPHPFCSDLCIAQCACPANKPIYDNGHCIREQDC